MASLDWVARGKCLKESKELFILLVVLNEVGTQGQRH